MTLTQLSSAKCFGGVVRKYAHMSTITRTEMKFSVFLPSSALSGTVVPGLYWLSGLTCNEDNFITKAGAQRSAEHHQLAIICPDTSPRGLDIEGQDDSYDFGSGAGFYINATTDKWKDNYQMYDYVTKELPALVSAELPISLEKKSIFGHSMGGHGSLVCFLKNPGMYKSCSAFSPICNPMNCEWGKKAFTGYLGANKSDWEKYDATMLMLNNSPPEDKPEILIEQGANDNFLADQLNPDAFVKACEKQGYPLKYRCHDGYDHSYYFISSFVEEHISHHAAFLK